MGRHEGNRPLGRHRFRLENNIKVKEMVWESEECDHVVQNNDKWRAVANMVLNLQVA